MKFYLSVHITLLIVTNLSKLYVEYVYKVVLFATRYSKYAMYVNRFGKVERSFRTI